MMLHLVPSHYPTPTSSFILLRRSYYGSRPMTPVAHERFFAMNLLLSQVPGPYMSARRFPHFIGCSALLDFRPTERMSVFVTLELLSRRYPEVRTKICWDLLAFNGQLLCISSISPASSTPERTVRVLYGFNERERYLILACHFEGFSSQVMVRMICIFVWVTWNAGPYHLRSDWMYRREYDGR